MEVKEEVEPPDEVLSSPYSILKARPKPSATPIIAAKVVCIFLLTKIRIWCPHPQVDLEGRFEGAQPTPKASPVPSPPSNSPPESTTQQPPLQGRPSQQGSRKIKAEAFILNPLKGKADLPQIRRLESLPKVASAWYSISVLLGKYNISPMLANIYTCWTLEQGGWTISQTLLLCKQNSI